MTMNDSFTVLFPDGWQLKGMVFKPPPRPGERFDLGPTTWVAENVHYAADDVDEPARVTLRQLRRADCPEG